MRGAPLGAGGAVCGVSAAIAVSGAVGAKNRARADRDHLAERLPGIDGTLEQAVNAFTLMNAVGRDIWIGIRAFIFCYFSIGLTTRFGELAAAGAKPFRALASMS